MRLAEWSLMGNGGKLGGFSAKGNGSEALNADCVELRVSPRSGIQAPVLKQPKMKPSRFFLGVLAAGLVSCVSPKFERAWKASPQQRWSGRWYSEKHHSGGRLRAVLSQPEKGAMDAFFEAHWHGFTTAYPVTLEARKQGAGYRLEGQKDLKSCVGGGLYHYTGTLLPGDFAARYSSASDFGSFHLTPAP